MKKFVLRFARLLSIAPALCLEAWVMPVLGKRHRHGQALQAPGPSRLDARHRSLTRDMCGF
jgi:hypothetical protein